MGFSPKSRAVEDIPSSTGDSAWKRGDSSYSKRFPSDRGRTTRLLHSPILHVETKILTSFG